jgi:hypothetical protein
MAKKRGTAGDGILFSILADMAEDPDGFRSNVRRALLDLTDDYKLPGVSPAREARDTAKQIINGILANERPIKASQ